MQGRVPAARRGRIDGMARRFADGFVVRLIAHHAKPAGLALTGVAIFLIAVFLWEMRITEIARTEADAGNLVQLLEEQTHAVFKSSDLTLRIIRNRLEHAPDLPANDPGFRAFLRELIAEEPYVRALFVIGPDGFIIHDTDYPETPHVSLADRDYFEVQQRNPGRGLYVGHPLLSRSVDRWFVPLSRALRGPDGSFAGVVVAALEPRFFESIYRRLNLSQYDSVALLHKDSTLIARAPALPDVYGRKWLAGRLFSDRLPNASKGAFDTISVSGRAATMGYTVVDGFPLIVTAALDAKTALAGWRRSAWVVGITVLFVVLAIVLFAVLLNRRKLETELVQNRAVTAHRLETLGQMTGSVAHDFNNVLATISAAAELIRRRGMEVTFLDSIDHAIERGCGLTTGLLSFARRQEYDRRRANPIELLRSLDVVISQLAGRGVMILRNYAPAPCECLIDRAQFDACILNLVTNASHAMPQGGTITIDARKIAAGPEYRLKPGDYAHIRIADTGNGIDPAIADRVFQPFFTTKGDQGTGLGLTQVHNFMMEMGGVVRLNSTPGAGTQVDLYFPCDDAIEPADTATGKPQCAA